MRERPFGFIAFSAFFGAVSCFQVWIFLSKLLGYRPDMPVLTALVVGVSGLIAAVACVGYWERQLWTPTAARLWLVLAFSLYAWVFVGGGAGIPDLLRLAIIPFGSALMGLIFTVHIGTNYLFRFRI